MEEKFSEKVNKSFVVEGAVDRKMFERYIKKILARTLGLAMLSSWIITQRS